MQRPFVVFTLSQNGCHYGIPLPSFKLPLVASFWNLKFKRIFPLNEATRANLQENKSTLKWRPFWNKMYSLVLARAKGIPFSHCIVSRYQYAILYNLLFLAVGLILR